VGFFLAREASVWKKKKKIEKKKIARSERAYVDRKEKNKGQPRHDRMSINREVFTKEKNGRK
jgi:hypothetical protein